MTSLEIAGRPIGAGHPVYVIAEISANHRQRYEEAERLVRAAREAGADAVKFQTYRPDTLTLDCDRPEFRIGGGSPWDGQTLHDLYASAYMPWEWQPPLIELAHALGLHAFSTPFDSTAVDFLANLDVPAYKVASFEVVDVPLLRAIARRRRPVIVSTGMASLAEIELAVNELRREGAPSIALLKCTSAYPAPPGSMNLRTLPHLAGWFGLPVGLSDHSLGIAAAVAAVALGASIVEKHLTLDRAAGGPDAAFSLEPAEFAEMVAAVRVAEAALGGVVYGGEADERVCRSLRRSLFVVRDVAAGQTLTEADIRSIRPGDGLSPRYWDEVIGRRAAMDLTRGTPLAWKHVA